MAENPPEALWDAWRAHAAERLNWQADELEAGGGPGVFNEDQRDIAAQTWRNAANKISSMPMPPLPQKEAVMSNGCDQSDDPSERCGYHHPTETANIIGTKDCCCGTPWLDDLDRCGSGAVEGDADKTYMEYLRVLVRALEADLAARGPKR